MPGNSCTKDLVRFKRIFRACHTLSLLDKALIVRCFGSPHVKGVVKGKHFQRKRQDRIIANIWVSQRLPGNSRVQAGFVKQFLLIFLHMLQAPVIGHPGATRV